MQNKKKTNLNWKKWYKFELRGMKRWFSLVTNLNLWLFVFSSSSSRKNCSALYLTINKGAIVKSERNDIVDAIDGMVRGNSINKVINNAMRKKNVCVRNFHAQRKKKKLVKQKTYVHVWYKKRSVSVILFPVQMILPWPDFVWNYFKFNHDMFVNNIS